MPSNEKYIEEAIRSSKDLTSLSSELTAKAKDWPSHYHLSMRRSVMLRAFAWNKSWQVLELGGGCGALTRYLGEKSASVDMVEANKSQADIAALRCRDLDNVKIHTADPAAMKFEKRYDIVVLTDIRESLQGIAAYERYLSRAKSALKDDGVLVLAIENKFGLKYFSGCAEEVAGQYFESIEGYPPDPDNRSVTFGLNELKSLLKRSGFEDHQFYFPYPDHKFGSMVVSDKALSRTDRNYGELVCQHGSKNYSGKRQLLFLERLAAYELGKNQALGFFAPSFLVFASPGKGKEEFRVSWEACLFSLSRGPKYRTVTRFGPSGQIDKTYLEPELDRKGSLHRLHSSHWIEGETLDLKMLRALSRNEGIDIFYQYLAQWHRYLDSKKITERLMPSDSLDLVPWNLIVTPEHEIKEFDAEWDLGEPIPIEWVLFRGMFGFVKYYSGYKGRLDFKALFGTDNIDDISKLLFGKLGYQINDRSLDELKKKENGFLLMLAATH